MFAEDSSREARLELEPLIRRLYVAFNRRDIDAVLAALTDDVVWANGLDGGYVHGREGVRAYWTEQFTRISSTVEPIAIERQPDGRIRVEVHQTVRDADSQQVLADTRVSHLFTFTGGSLISRFEIGDSESNEHPAGGAV